MLTLKNFCEEIILVFKIFLEELEMEDTKGLEPAALHIRTS